MQHYLSRVRPKFSLIARLGVTPCEKYDTPSHFALGYNKWLRWSAGHQRGKFCCFAAALECAHGRFLHERPRPRTSWQTVQFEVNYAKIWVIRVLELQLKWSIKTSAYFDTCCLDVHGHLGQEFLRQKWEKCSLPLKWPLRSRHFHFLAVETRIIEIFTGRFLHQSLQ